MLSLPKPYLSRLMRAVNEFDLIHEGDNILIGLSGGKDSLFLTYALACLKQISPRPFSLQAFTLDPMFTDSFDTAALADFCQRLDIPFATRKADIAQAIKNNQEKEPCFTCAFFRRGAINRFAKSQGCNKVALAHHHDDAVETFFMGMLYSGQLQTFLPATFLNRTGLTVIRPLIYFREREIIDTYRLHGLKPIPSPCPFNGKTKRQETKELIVTLEKTIPHLYEHLASAMRTGEKTVLWPQALPRQDLYGRSKKFWDSQETK